MEKKTEKQLRFHEDGHFRILMISDFHGRPDYNPKLKAGIEALVAETNPDFVMLGGDQLANTTPEELHTYLESVMEPIQKRNIPWAHVLGNHDPEQKMDKDSIEEVYESFPLCLSERGPRDISGVGNYCLPILAHDSDEPMYRLWALDSHSSWYEYKTKFGMPDSLQRSDFVLPHKFSTAGNQATPMFDQVIWYYTESRRMEAELGRKVPALMFMHVPPIEFNLIPWNPEETHMIGQKRESPASSELNNGLFFACLERGDVKGIFCGHEHLNDYQGEYLGITLAYDAAVGYDMSAHDDLRGGRVIDIYENGAMHTRMLHLIDLLGRDAMRNPDYFEGGCPYFIRVLP